MIRCENVTYDMLFTDYKAIPHQASIKLINYGNLFSHINLRIFRKKKHEKTIESHEKDMLNEYFCHKMIRDHKKQRIIIH